LCTSWRSLACRVVVVTMKMKRLRFDILVRRDVVVLPDLLMAAV